MMVAMLFMASVNVSAYEDHYDDLQKAQEDLELAVHEGMALNDELMTKDVKARLSEAVTAANAVYDSDRKESLDEINAVMPDLVKCIDEAKVSKEQCAIITLKAKEFVENELKAIEDAADDEKNQAEAVQEALNSLYDQCDNVIAFLGTSENISDEMVTAINAGKTIRDILKMAGYDLPTIEETITAAGIHSVENTVSGNDAEYSLSGVRVQSGYKGIILKGGKKMVRK